MLNNILNLEGVAVLNKKQQMSVNGGECAYYNGVTGQVDYHVSSSSAAQAMLTNASDHWCCASCSTASWYGNGCSGNPRYNNDSHDYNCIQWDEIA